MDSSIKNLPSTTFCGRRFSRKQIAEIQHTVHSFSLLSRHELAQTVCEHLQWHTHKGENRVHACLHMLESLEQSGVLRLPHKVEHPSNRGQNKLQWSVRSEAQSDIDDDLEQLTPIGLRVVSDPPQIREWNELVDRYHYLGYKRAIGCHLRYFVVDRQDRKLGCLMFSYAVKSLPCRDEWVGWQDQSYKKHLERVVNNNRFLIFPWVKVTNLASKVLSMACRQLPDDWQRHHGYRPVLMETFVDPSQFNATSYRAANWLFIGNTQPRSGKTPKQVYVYPLVNDFRSILMQGPQRSVKKPAKSSPVLPTTITQTDPFVQLWQNILGTMVSVADDFDLKWQQRKRVLNTLLIMLFIFRLVFSKNRQGYAITIAELWQQCRILEVSLPQPTPVAASAMCQARAKLDENVFKVLQVRILQHTERHGCDSLWNGHRIFAVDGSKLNLPRQLIHSGYRTPAEQVYHPQGLVSTLYGLQTQIPIDFDLAAHGDERKMALAHLSCLGAGDVVVYDRGYYSYAMLYEHVARGLEVVFRMRRNVGVVFDQFMTSVDTDQRVEVCPSHKSKVKVREKHPDAECGPIRVRLVKYTVAATTYTLATTLLDVRQYPIEELSNLYHARWGIEELYKISKQLMAVEEFHGQTERGVKQELYAHFVLVTLTRLFANRSEDGFNPLDDAEQKPEMQANFKNSLLVVGRNIEALMLRQVEFLTATVNQILEGIGSCRQRKRTGRSYERRSRKPESTWRRRKAVKVV